MSEGRNSFKIKHLEKYFMPMEIDAKVILQAFKIQQNRRMLSSNRTKIHAVENKVEEQIDRVQLLRVTGKELHNTSPQNYRIKSHRKDIKNIKIVLDNPFNKIVQEISQDPDSRHYRHELGELQKLSSSTPKQILVGFDRNVFSQKDLQLPFKSKHLSSNSSEKQSEDYYQQLIINNPILFRKIMMAYNASKRQMQRDTKLNFRKSTPFRETVYESKLIQRAQFSQLPKNVSDSKKVTPYQLYREFQLTINLSNRMLVYPQNDLQYKAYIGKGNNGLLVKSILKSRPWWSIRSHSQMDSCNLVWTEWKRNKFTNGLVNGQPQFCRNRGKPIEVIMGSKKRQYLLLADKKINHVKKLVGKEDEFWLRYEKAPQLQNYLNFSNKINDSKFDQVTKRLYLQSDYAHITVTKDSKMGNHIPGCLQLHSKKLLFLNMKQYYEQQGKDIFSVVPITFHITKGAQDPQFYKFIQHFEEQANKQRGKGRSPNIWICKPGQNSNRGNGISVMNTINQIKNLANQKCVGNRSLIIQKYFQNPFLYNKRKFDLRCYALITCCNGIVKGYWYEQGYIRTASKQFSLKNLQNKFIHLTNDAIQKKGEQYGKFQNFNKVSYAEFQKYLQTNHNNQNFNFDQTQQRMKTIATDLILSTSKKLNPKRKQLTFQIFGLDFMLDDRLNPFLIEANSNPCIEVDGNVLARVIPSMLQNVIRVAIDPIFPPPNNQIIRSKYSPSNMFQSNKMVLIYDSFVDETEGNGESEKQVNEEECEQQEGDALD